VATNKLGKKRESSPSWLSTSPRLHANFVLHLVNPYVRIPVRIGSYPGIHMGQSQWQPPRQISSRSYHDLSQIISEEMPAYPGEPHPEFKPHFTIGKCLFAE